MKRTHKIAYRTRWLVLLLGLASWGAWLWWMTGGLPGWLESNEWSTAGLWGTPLFFFDDADEWLYWAVLFGFLGLCLITQWLLLCPRGGYRVKLNETGRPMLLSIAAAGFAAMLLTVGAIFTTIEGFVQLFQPSDIDSTWTAIGQHFDDEAPALQAIWTVAAILWSLWGIVFYFYWRGTDRYDQTAWMIRQLLRGSFLEFFASIPIAVIAYRRDSCYCAAGSYTGLVFGLTVALWCFGPAMILLFLGRKRYIDHLKARDTEGVRQESESSAGNQTRP